VGIFTPGEGITIYPIHAKALKEFDDEPERWIDLAWDISEGSNERFPTEIIVTVLNEPGALAQVALVIGENDGNIANLSILNRAPDFFEIRIEVEVCDVKHLNKIIAELRRKTVVSRTQRVSA